MTFANKSGSQTPALVDDLRRVTVDISGGVAEIIDTTTSATYTYHCEAAPGTASSAPAWRISRLTNATGVIQWADGNAYFNNVADDRASLTYS